MSPDFQYIFYVYAAPISALLCILVLAYARLRYPTPDTTALSTLMLAVSGWLVFNTLELVAAGQATTVFWAKVSYPFIVMTPVAWLAFALRYTGQAQRLKPRWIMIYSLVPAITVLLVWSNELHRLMWAAYTFTPVNNWLAFSVQHGPWFAVHMAYSYLLVFIGAYLLVRNSLTTFDVYRRQSLLLATGALIPVIFNIVYVFQITPGLKKDYTAMSFALASLLFATAMVRYHLFDLRPVARRTVVDSMSDAMLVMDRQGRVLDANPTALALLERTSSQIIGQPVDQVMHEWKELIALIHPEASLQTELCLERGGMVHYLDPRISILRDEHQRILGRLLVLHDITARKQAEAELQRYAQELEARNQELDAFAHTVAHDLKTPLSSLIGYSHLLRTQSERLAPQEINEFLEMIGKNGRRMTNIIDELLLLSSVRKQQDIPRHSLDMALIVAGALDRLQSVISEEHVAISLPAAWPTAIGYAPWIEEVWVNYISNATKYGGHPAQIEIGADDSVNGQVSCRMVRFWVRDNGEGLTADEQRRLFIPFTRLEKVSASGHGLGLSIVQRIIERLDGEVGVESQPGQGSLFWFRLPAEIKD